MNNMYTRDTFQQALSFLVSQITFIEPQVIRIRYPELNYADFVPIDQTANEWAKSITFFSIDQVGQAGWFNANASDVPYADFQREIHEQAIELAAIGYRYNLEELAQAAMLPNTNLSIERASSARRAYEEFCHNAVMYGDSRKNWLGLTNHTLPSVITLTTTWASRLTGATPSPASILQDFNAITTNIWQSSLTVEMADTALMPLSIMTMLSMAQLPNTTMNLLAWIHANNLYTTETGRAMVIRGVRGLDTAGSGGTGRIVLYQKDPSVLKLHRPMSHRFLPVWQKGPLVFEVPGIFRLGGLEIRRPGAFRYADGAC
jgi:hypothetical protein